MLAKAGMQVDVQVMDTATWARRLVSRRPPADGGWNIFCTSIQGIDALTPAGHMALRATATMPMLVGRTVRRSRHCALIGSMLPTSMRSVKILRGTSAARVQGHTGPSVCGIIHPSTAGADLIGVPMARHSSGTFCYQDRLRYCCRFCTRYCSFSNLSADALRHQPCPGPTLCRPTMFRIFLILTPISKQCRRLICVC